MTATITPATGFQKSAVRQSARALRAEAAEREGAQPLNPEYPYAYEAFDPTYWGLPANPAGVTKES